MTVTQTIWTPMSAAPILIGSAHALRPGPTSPAVDAFMTIRDVAAACKLSETAVRRAISDGELPAIKLRSRLRITPADFDAWIASQRQSPVGATAPPRSATPARRPAPAGSFRALVHADAAREQAR
jgi:excisionase family DNA binding protein